MSVTWHRDPAASGWRSRAFLTLGECLVYDTGDWEVRTHEANGHTVEAGRVPDIDAAKAHALSVYAHVTGADAEDR